MSRLGGRLLLCSIRFREIISIKIKRAGDFMKIPYDKIDKEMITLIQAMNAHESIYTLGCCIGHNGNKCSEVIFNVKDEDMWQPLMIKILNLNNEFKNVNVDLYQWHRLSVDNQHTVNWVMKIEVHPGIDNKAEILKIKLFVLYKLLSIIKDDRAATLPSFGDQYFELPMHQ